MDLECPVFFVPVQWAVDALPGRTVVQRAVVPAAATLLSGWNSIPRPVDRHKPDERIFSPGKSAAFRRVQRR
jgi:hypothetical protein